MLLYSEIPATLQKHIQIKKRRKGKETNVEIAKSVLCGMVYTISYLLFSPYIDTDKMQIVNTIYSFSYEDVFNFDEVYYDSDTKYTEGCTYDCTIYTFYCVSNETFASYKFLVVGNGNTSKSGQVFNLENKSSECIDSFAKEILSNNIDNVSGKCTCLLIFTGIIIIVLFFVIPIYLEIRNKKNRYNLHYF